jgi:hypothetical protein
MPKAARAASCRPDQSNEQRCFAALISQMRALRGNALRHALDLESILIRVASASAALVQNAPE